MKKTGILAVLIAITLGTVTIVFALGSTNHKALDVSVLNLIVTPERYHHRLVRVIGVGQIEFEGDALYLSKDDLQYGICKNGIWIEPDYQALNMDVKELQQWNGKYVIIEGVFDKREQGHMGLFSGAIKNITLYDLWERDWK